MNESSKTLMSQAALNEHETVIKLLLDNGVAVDSMDESGKTPLSWAARNGQHGMGMRQ